MRKFGHANTYCFSFFMVSVRSILWAFPFSSSLPYEFIAYGFLDMFRWLHMAAMVEYTGVIAPARLTATALALTSGLTWIVGSGLGALVSGQIMAVMGMRIMFIIFGIFGCCFSLFYWTMYHMIIKQFEPNCSADEEVESSQIETNGKQDATYLDNLSWSNNMHFTHL